MHTDPHLARWASIGLPLPLTDQADIARALELRDQGAVRLAYGGRSKALHDRGVHLPSLLIAILAPLQNNTH